MFVEDTATRLCLVILFAAAAAPAQSPGDPLTLIRVIRDFGETRDPSEPYRLVKWSTPVTAMRAITGNTQTWMIEQHGSSSSLEKLDQALSDAGTFAQGNVSLIGLYRHALSYRPDEAVKLMHNPPYVQVSIYRARPGYEVDFAEVMRMRRAALDAVNSERPELGYQIMSGAISGTYLFVAPLTSLKTFDQSLAWWLNHPDIAVPPRSRETRQITAEADITREHLLFRIEPRWNWRPDQSK